MSFPSREEFVQRPTARPPLARNMHRNAHAWRLCRITPDTRISRRISVQLATHIPKRLSHQRAPSRFAAMDTRFAILMKALFASRSVISSIVFALFAAINTQAQISISALNSAVTENFNSIGTTTSLPTNWRVSPQNGGASPTWSAGVGTVTQAAHSGSPSAGGRYNWGTSSTERSVGFMTSGSYASPNSVMAFYQNNTGSTISSVNISYDIERYRINSAAASVSMFYSTDGTSWTSITGTTSTFSTATSSYTFASPTTDSKSIALTALSIATGTSLYLRWNFNTTGSNSQGLGLDNVSLTAVPEPSTYAAMAGAVALLGVMVHRRRQRVATKV